MSTDGGDEDAHMPAHPPPNPKLIRVLESVARRLGLDLERLLRERYQVERPERRTAGQLTHLIDELTASGSRPRADSQRRRRRG